jgi:mono/diheme cytochrome c family protein
MVSEFHRPSLSRLVRAARIRMPPSKGPIWFPMAGALACILFAGVTYSSEEFSPDVEAGHYLVVAANCSGCHTQSADKPFAGGVALKSVFGTVYSTNITPDAETGIGRWTQEDFTRALREGVGLNGEHLYPAFPYTAFTQLTDSDIAAIYRYLKTLAPARSAAPQNDLGFPYNQRALLRIWKALYFNPVRFVPSASRSNEWNRGAYLVNALGHCGSCHSPRNFLGAEKEKWAMTGGTIIDQVGNDRARDWSSTNLTEHPNGLKSWSVEDLQSYLWRGTSFRADVFGVMNNVVMNSTRHLTPADARAMAVYIKSLAPQEDSGGSSPSAEAMRLGSPLYEIHCGTCHLPTGLGSPSTGTPLVGSAIALAADPTSLINIVLNGPQLPSSAPSKQWLDRKWQLMDAFGEKMSDQEIASLLTYVRNSWGNHAGAVNADQVLKQR